MFIRRAQNALCHFQTLCRSRRRSRRNARRLRRPASSAVMSPAKLWSPGPSTGESSNHEGLPARTPKRPWQLSRGEDEVWTQNSAALVTAFGRPSPPPGAAGSLGVALVLCLGGDRPHSEHSFFVPTCLFACFKSEAPGTAFSFCFLLVAGLEGLSWSWNHKLDKPQGVPHPPKAPAPSETPPPTATATHGLSGPRPLGGRQKESSVACRPGRVAVATEA